VFGRQILGEKFCLLAARGNTQKTGIVDWVHFSIEKSDFIRFSICAFLDKQAVSLTMVLVSVFALRWLWKLSLQVLSGAWWWTQFHCP